MIFLDARNNLSALNILFVTLSINTRLPCIPVFTFIASVLLLAALYFSNGDEEDKEKGNNYESEREDGNKNEELKGDHDDPSFIISDIEKNSNSNSDGEIEDVISDESDKAADQRDPADAVAFVISDIEKTSNSNSDGEIEDVIRNDESDEAANQRDPADASTAYTSIQLDPGVKSATTAADLEVFEANKMTTDDEAYETNRKQPDVDIATT
eukprot:CAMPEP_0204876798 /NCGR_PEP_ID=MMETSP1348-20121228/47836_1 /ASSEMBLY_ACC=CAM_ASM_000700 /TAXON_ID=215587 /ORGANISM="Aplanochytrium stocchinoi, Strain GSBS06" /LENGTH=211 /DNA_ID=CAMNT_0052033595 /DNA_START=872 /DNA_END=1507 /DNA_ORIENTATION=-